ncbi:MAG TPA: hypothetical protein ENK32_07905, partial [Anaerolineae bacterium]|nr:hypothetical protein [Anaerolineae bacterium]
MRYLMLLLFMAVLAACATAPTPIPPTATAVPPNHVTTEVREVTLEPSPLPETAVIQPCPDIEPGEMVGSVTEEDGRSTYINPVMGIQVEYPASLRLTEPQYETPDSYGFFIDEGRAAERPFVMVNWLIGLTAEQLETHIQAVIDAYPTIPVERETIAAAGQEAILLAPLPGAETTSHVYLTANNRVYQLIFWQYPLNETARQFLDGFRFVPPTVGYNCLDWPAYDGVPPVPTATPVPDPAEPAAETLLLYTAVTTPTNTTYWGLASWPAAPPFTEELFATFYGRTAHAEDMRRYFFNFRPQPSPDGRYLLLPSVGGYGRPPQDESTGLWLVDLVDGHLRRLLPRPVIAGWSPDGRQIAYVQDNALYTRALDGAAAPQPIFTHPDLSSIFIDWSPDGRQLAAMTISQNETGPIGTVWLVPPDGAAPQQLPAAIPLSFEPVRSQLAWSPDGRYLLAANTILDLSGNVAIEYVAAEYAIGLITWLPEENRLLVVDGERMWLADAAGRETAVISEKRPSTWAFSPDGRQLAWAQKVEESGQIAIYFTDLSTLETQFAAMAPTRGFFQMRWGPDGRLYLDDWAQNRIWAMEARLRSTAQLAVEDAALVAIIPLLTPPANQSDGWSGNPVVSDDGRVVAFLSNGKLTDHTHNGRTAVYARDLAAEQNWLASLTLSWQRPFDDIQSVALSGNGRTVAFYSFDGRLTLDDNDSCQTDFAGPCEDLYVTDWKTGEIERIPLGRTSGLGADYTMALSADGRKL